MRIIMSSLVASLVFPAMALAHGIGEHSADEEHMHIEFLDLAIGLGTIAAIALTWALLARKKQ